MGTREIARGLYSNQKADVSPGKERFPATGSFSDDHRA